MTNTPGISSIDVSEQFQQDPLGALLEATRYGGDMVEMLTPVPFLLLNHPEVIGEVLLHLEQFPKPPQDSRSKAVMGQGLIISNGAEWKHQRSMLQPGFHQSYMAAYSSVIAIVVATMLERWDGFAQQHAPMDIAAEMQRATLSIACQALFGVDLMQQSSWLVQALSTLTSHTTPAELFEAMLLQVNDFAFRTIKNRRGRSETHQDVLGLLLQAEISEQAIRDEMLNLLIAGYDTTASFLTWFWYFLATYPEVEQRLHAEISNVLGGHLPTLDMLRNLHYLQMALDETLRLAPPVWAATRIAANDVRLGNYAISSGTLLLLSPYTTHRHPTFWQDPDVFYPERFVALEKRSAGRPQFAFYPFGGGSRKCIGDRLAMLEAQYIVAMVAQRYKLRPLPGYVAQPEPSLSLRMRGGLPMTLEGIT